MSQKHVLIEEGGFELIAQPGEYWASWVAHTTRDCSSEPIHPASNPWRWVNVFEGCCTYCPILVPDGILGVWKLHNFDNYTKALRIRSGLQGRY